MIDVDIYCDGGVCGSNPSSIGGTTAFYILDHKTKNIEIWERAFYEPKEWNLEKITNNQTELWAMLKAIRILDENVIAHVYCDSEITIGRVFKHYAMSNVPKFMFDVLKDQMYRLKNFHKFEYTLLAGHPTKKQIEEGTGRNGLPVSVWNKRCDDMCKLSSIDHVTQYEEN